jgi:phospholipid/cholesterol/gamma-HCH transport system permease protein
MPSALAHWIASRHNASHVGAAPTLLPVPDRMADDAVAELRATVLRQPQGAVVVLDCAPLTALDALAAARLLRLIAEARAHGIDVRLKNLSQDVRRALTDVDPAILEPDPPAPPSHPIEAIGSTAIGGAEAAVEVARLMRDSVAVIARPFGRHGIKWGRTLHQMQLIGVSAVPIVVFISFLVGIVLALNGATQLRQFGAAIFIANLVGISMTREMGPLMTAVIVAGRSGSAIAAEIGSMVVSEEVDALRTMALSPVRFLVVPKILALVIMLPLLVVLSNAAGIFGGYVVGVAALDLASSAYLTQTVQALVIGDVISGLVKSVVFALIIGLTGVYRGFAVRGGSEAVGLATTAAVVTSIILCIIANAFFTAFFYVTG